MRIFPRGPWYWVAFRLGVVLPIVLYAVYIGLLVVAQDALLFPAPNLSDERLQQHAAVAGAQELRMTTADGETTYGWHLPGTDDQVVLYFHGNGGSVHNGSALKDKLGPSWHVVSASYQGYPGGTGSTSEQTLRLSGLAAWDTVVGELGFSPERVVIHGRSLGGSVAAYVAVEHPPAALVMESTFLSMAEVAQTKHPLAPVDLLLRHPLRTRERAPQIAAPTLVLHSTDDGLIPVSHGRELGTLFPNATYVERPGFSHNQSLIFGDDSAQEIWLNHVNGAIRPGPGAPPGP